MKRGIDADLELTFDDGTLWVHSSVLVLGSVVFKSMLSSGTTEETAWKIKLPGKSKATFELFYNMLHIETVVPLTKKNMWVVAELADEYQTLNLLERALKFIEQNGLTDDTLARSYANAIRLGFESLQETIEDTKIAKSASVFDFFYDDYVFDTLPDNIHENLRLCVVRVANSVPKPSSYISTDCWRPIPNLPERSWISWTPRDLSFSTKYKCKAVLRVVTNFNGLQDDSKCVLSFLTTLENIYKK